ncbi:MAG: division/cell wall cluster transcriptional repressor MraZ [Thermoanaerobaculia bacterium]
MDSAATTSSPRFPASRRSSIRSPSGRRSSRGSPPCRRPTGSRSATSRGSATTGSRARLDAQGRLLVPPIVRSAAAGMSGEVVVSARIDHLVVWNRERFEKRLEEHPFTDDDFAKLAERGI